jgi:hypothetical protein
LPKSAYGAFRRLVYGLAGVCSQSSITTLQPLILFTFLAYNLRHIRLLVDVLKQIHKHDSQA